MVVTTTQAQTMEPVIPEYRFNYTRTFTEKSTYASFVRYLMMMVTFSHDHYITHFPVTVACVGEKGDYITEFVKRGWYLIGAVFDDEHKTTYVNIPFPTDDNFKKHFTNVLASPQSNPVFNFSLREDKGLSGKNEDGTKTRFRIWTPGHYWRFPGVMLAFAHRDYVFQQLSKLGFNPKILAKLEKPFTQRSYTFGRRYVYEPSMTLRMVKKETQDTDHNVALVKKQHKLHKHIAGNIKSFLM